MVRAEKARLMRELRGTKAKKQREALGTPPITIGATGTGASITPMPTPASPVAPPTTGTRTAI